MRKTAVRGTKRPCCLGKTSFHLAQLLAQQESTSSLSSGKNSTKSMSVTQSLTQNMPIFTTIPDPIPIAKSTDFRFHPQKW